MIKKLSFGLSFISLFLVSCITIALQSDKPLYQTPSYQKLEKLVYTMSKVDLASDQHCNNITNIAVTSFLQEYPKNINTIIAKFNHYPNEVKLIFANALMAIEGTKVVERLKYALPSLDRPLSVKDVEKMDLIRVWKLGHLASIPAIADYLWAAFEGSGKEEYLTKILKYLSAENQENKAYALEILNRQRIDEMVQKIGLKEKELKDVTSPPFGLKGLKEEVDKLSKSNPNCSWERALFYSPVIWSMESQRKQNPDIEAKVVRLLKKHSELDYRKGIRKLSSI